MNSQFVSGGAATLNIDNSPKSYPMYRCANVPDMIDSCIAVHSDSQALVEHGRTISFAELNRLANAVAAGLREVGIRRNDPVGIYFESSIEFVVAALGVWKAGGAYLPIDPAYPADRATFILADSGAPAVITRSSLATALQSDRWTTLLIEELTAKEPTDAPQPAIINAEDLAYVIYTSGSTGQPKGVEITHGNLANLAEWHNREFAIDRNDRATQIAGPGFDAAVWEIWPYLAAGASVYFPAREARLSGVQLRDWLLAEKITVSFVPTVLAEEILGLHWPASASLRYLLTGGDALHTFPADDAPFQLVNNYGPTECTVVATSAPVAKIQGQGAPPIGRAILNTSIYLLDEMGQPVSDGETGELYIGGASVGRGYRNRPDLTAKSFVEISVAGKTERVFRTGDLARKLPDGQFAFAGRADDQIKIRGFRIEPGEIASILNRHAAVVSSAVIARNDTGEKRLVAYLVPAEGSELVDSELRELLTRHLPDYMIPANFVLVSRIPVTPNGKLDAAALPAPTDQNQVRRDTYIAPRNEFEEIVEGIVAPILGLQKVSIHDNFFLLGGHSLMGAQLISKIRDIFDVELVLRNVFECPTVAKLAARIETLLTARLESMSDEEVREALMLHPVAQLAGSSPAIKAG